MQNDSNVIKEFATLFDDIQRDDTFPNKRPLLAHYTSITTLEHILDKNEVWFSNPLFMNDLEELRFGILQSVQQFLGSDVIRNACGTKECFDKLTQSFNYYFNLFDNEHAFNTYVFCLSEHDALDTDGTLSMWRGYGGNGNGAAIVFDTNQFNFIPSSPLVVSKVEYASSEKRLEWITKKMIEFANLLQKVKLDESQLYIAAYSMFERIKIFALFTKHQGFSEEREWRVVYLKDRDTNKKLESMFHYAVGQRGIEPKLKLKVEPIEGITADDLSLNKIVHKIILGPTTSHPLAISATMRMLERLGRSELKNRLFASRIPFRII